MNVSSWYTSKWENTSGRKTREYEKLKWIQWTRCTLPFTTLNVGVFPKKGESLRSRLEAEKGDGKYHFLSGQRN